MKENTFDTGEVVLNYAEGPPSGAPFLMLHGVCARWQGFLSIIPHFLPFWQVYAVDFRGHGKSGRVPGHYQVQDYVGDLQNFIEAQLTEPIVLFGHSLGGRVALNIAAAKPAKVRAVIVGDTPLSTKSLQSRGDFTSTFTEWHRLVALGLSIDELAYALGEMAGGMGEDGKPQKFKDFWDQADLRFTAKCLSMVAPEILLKMADPKVSGEYEPQDLMRNIHCPVLLLQGSPALGALMTDSDIELALTQLNSGCSVRIAGAGHSLHIQQPIAVIRAVNNFLGSL